MRTLSQHDTTQCATTLHQAPCTGCHTKSSSSGGLRVHPSNGDGGASSAAHAAACRVPRFAAWYVSGQSVRSGAQAHEAERGLA